MMSAIPHRRSRAGVTLVELLVVLAMMSILVVALGYTFAAGLQLERLQTRQQTQQERLNQMEQRLTAFLQAAKISENADDDTTYFIGESESGDTSLGSDRLTFTTLAPSVSLAVQESEDDFETQQQTQGPTGGAAEVSLGLTAIGDPGDHAGLFQRVQRPADSDSTQGGMESLLDSQVETIGFEFYSGLDWVKTWTTIGGERRLPSAVRVNYRLQGDPAESSRSFIVTIPASDVDAQDPSNNGAAL
jgi:prepilin-type N-terminal cleavage/methylation domain-containing protein